HTLDNGWRSADDFLAQFGPLELMRGLDGAPELRGIILTKAVGFHEKIARKKTAESAADDLRIALEENVTSPADILALFPTDDRIRYLDRQKLFAFAVDDGFFAAPRVGEEQERALDRLMYLIETALGEGLLTFADFADGVTFETISASLAPDDLRRLLTGALTHGRAGEPLTEERLLAIVPLRTVVGRISLEVTWRNVVLAKVARPAGLVSGRASANSPSAAPETTPSRTPAAIAPSLRGSNGKSKAPPPAPPIITAPAVSVAAEPVITPNAVNVAPPSSPAPSPASAPISVDAPIPLVDPFADIESEVVIEAAEGPPSEANEELAARAKVVERLTNINRLPPRHADLSIQLLFAIDSMYADLASAASDEEREDAVRDAFPNHQHAAVALLALLELLEPSIKMDPDVAKADIDALVNVFLIEERRYQRERSEPQKSAATPSTTPAPGTARRGAPPPLPRGTPMPPPLPSEKGR
ncbi:MAG TPA: hypothetical protein VFQ61_31900, partial [Polyangiaceae bacterium]|nr:hypothetical protein [Polyangiaceae bacterium]